MEDGRQTSRCLDAEVTTQCTHLKQQFSTYKIGQNSKFCYCFHTAQRKIIQRPTSFPGGSDGLEVEERYVGRDRYQYYPDVSRRKMTTSEVSNQKLQLLWGATANSQRSSHRGLPAFVHDLGSDCPLTGWTEQPSGLFTLAYLMFLAVLGGYLGKGTHQIPPLCPLGESPSATQKTSTWAHSLS